MPLYQDLVSSRRLLADIGSSLANKILELFNSRLWHIKLLSVESKHFLFGINTLAWLKVSSFGSQMYIKKGTTLHDLKFGV